MKTAIETKLSVWKLHQNSFSSKYTFGTCSYLVYFPSYHFSSQEMAPKEGAIRKAGGRPREKNYAAGLPEDLTADKNLRTPVPSDEEDAADRDNRLQHIRRL